MRAIGVHTIGQTIRLAELARVGEAMRVVRLESVALSAGAPASTSGTDVQALVSNLTPQIPSPNSEISNLESEISNQKSAVRNLESPTREPMHCVSSLSQPGLLTIWP